MSRARAKNISDDDIAAIVSILDGWSGKLGWDLLIAAIERRNGSSYSRQALDKHERIKQAFVQRKKALAGNDGAARVVGSPELRAASERIQRLTAENARLIKENNSLLEQFVRWAYNANIAGLGIELLNAALPSVDRNQSDKKPSLVKSSAKKK
jgi:hypothetical protein